MSHKIPTHTVEGVEGMYRPWWTMKKPGLGNFPEKPDDVHAHDVNQEPYMSRRYVKLPTVNKATYETAREMAIWTADFVRLEAAQRHQVIIDRVRALHKWTSEALNTIQEGNTKAIAEIGNRLHETKAFKELDSRLNTYKKAIEEVKKINQLLTERVAQLEKKHRAKL